MFKDSEKRARLLFSLPLSKGEMCVYKGFYMGINNSRLMGNGKSTH